MFNMGKIKKGFWFNDYIYKFIIKDQKYYVKIGDEGLMS